MGTFDRSTIMKHLSGKCNMTQRGFDKKKIERMAVKGLRACGQEKGDNDDQEHKTGGERLKRIELRQRTSMMECLAEGTNAKMMELVFQQTKRKGKRKRDGGGARGGSKV